VIGLLRLAVAGGGLVPVAAGLGGMVLGPAMLGAGAPLALDSHFRYLSGLLLAIGLGFWSTIPRIAQHSARFRLLTLVVVCGGLGRLYGMLTHGMPGLPMRAALAMELVITPLLCLWQARIAA